MNTVINIRTDKKVRDEASRIFERMGLTLSAGMNMFLRQVIQEKGLPFQPTLDPEKIAEKWKREAEWALKHGKGYTSTKEMFDDIMVGR
ncbi:MAG: type II toxin-antitoxin system RelB/DinJ family antitoxin [bacterium]